MKFRKPQLIPLLFIVSATLLLCGLGTWQLSRMSWKLEQIRRVEAAQSEPVMGDLHPDLMGFDFEKIQYRNVAFTGKFMYDRQMHLIGRQMGRDVGYFVLTPFSLEDDGRIILVNRGFAPEGKDLRPKGLQTVRGIIRPARAKRLFAPENQPAKNVWFYEDLPAMGQFTGLALTPIIVEAVGEAQEGVYPIPGDGKVIFRNDHLVYAITWFSLALAGLVMFAFYHREKE